MPRRRNQEIALRSGREELEELLAILRAAFMTYRTGHWKAEGDDAYGNHLLLQRIYESTEKQIDALGERLVGHYGPGSVDLEKQRGLVDGWMFQFADESDPMVASLFAAEAIQQQIRRAFDALDPRPLGLDDLLMTFASEKDEHIYLLRQAVGRDVSVDSQVRRAFRYANPAEPSPRARRLFQKLSR